MARLLAVLACMLVATSGCGGTIELDNDPTVLGFTPQLRLEMRKLFREVEPATNDEQAVMDYMDKLRNLAQNLGCEEDKSGGYECTAKMKEILVGSKEADEAIAKLLVEFDVETPRWTEPLIKESRKGGMSEQRKELLRHIMVAELFLHLSK